MVLVQAGIGAAGAAIASPIALGGCAIASEITNVAGAAAIKIGASAIRGAYAGGF